MFALHDGALDDLLRGPVLRDRLRTAGARRLQVNLDDEDVAQAPLRFGPGTPITAVLSVWLDDPEDAAGLRSLLEQLGTATSELVAALTELLAGDELAATVARCELLLRRDVMPMPSGGRPSIPWPAF